MIISENYCIFIFPWKQIAHDRLQIRAFYFEYIHFYLKMDNEKRKVMSNKNYRNEVDISIQCTTLIAFIKYLQAIKLSGFGISLRK